MPGSRSTAPQFVGPSKDSQNRQRRTRSLHSTCVNLWPPCKRRPSSWMIALACSREPHVSARTRTAGHDRRFASSSGHTSGRSVATRRSRSGRIQLATRAATNPVPDPSSTAAIEGSVVHGARVREDVRVNGGGSNSSVGSEDGSRYASIAWDASLRSHRIRVSRVVRMRRYASRCRLTIYDLQCHTSGWRPLERLS